MYCEELNSLIQESGAQTAEFRGLEDELKMTIKGSSAYLEKSQALKLARGRLREAQKRVRQHMQDHGCR
jgi:hypothetical protein